MPQRSVCRQADQQRNDPLPGSAALAPARVRRGAIAWQDGMRAEQAACDALLAEGWSVLARRARTAAGEIDVVAARGGLLAFVEVKARSTLAEAASCLSIRQQRRLRDAAAILLHDNPDWHRDRIRFDLFLVDRDGRLRRIADAFRDEGDDAMRSL